MSSAAIQESAPSLIPALSTASTFRIVREQPHAVSLKMAECGSLMVPQIRLESQPLVGLDRTGLVAIPRLAIC